MSTIVIGLFVSGSYVFAATDIGIWRRPLSDAMAIFEQIKDDHIPGGFVLEQNYPNPFNQSTTINYQIPTAENVSLKVYDVLGSEVSTLVNEKELAGNYEVEFGTQDLPGGIYFYNFRAGNYAQIKKMILTK